MLEDDDNPSTWGDVYITNLQKKVGEQKGNGKLEKQNTLLEQVDRLITQKKYLQAQLRKAGAEIKNLEAEVKYERQLRLGGTAYHPTDYHSQLREMIVKVRKEKKLTDLFDIVDEAQRRIKNVN